jgi:hypothetical protein
MAYALQWSLGMAALQTPQGVEIPETVAASIRRAFRDHEEILRALRWDALNRCFYFMRWGMFVGVETDGYIHS